MSGLLPFFCHLRSESVDDRMESEIVVLPSGALLFGQ